MLTKNPSRQTRPTFTDQEALLFHSQGRPGKLEVIATKPMATQRDLSLAYSPGVAVPVLAIAEDEAAPSTTPPRAISWPSSPTAPPFWGSATAARSPPSR
jgi:malate dehydrogenase (oxaloacetate-decarboxylating)(NADP+)